MKDIRNITVSGRICSGATTVAKGIAGTLGWSLLEGGELFEKFFDKEKGMDTDRPDQVDLDYEKMIIGLLTTKSHQIIQSHLAGFDAREIPDAYKIVVLCEDENGNDLPEVRANRLIERKGVTKEEALKEIASREAGVLAKWRRLYANGDQSWVYWDKKYYDLVINTAKMNKEDALALALTSIEKYKE